MPDEQDEETSFLVVINEEEQYSIWPSRRDLPTGWLEVGYGGPKSDCLSYIDKCWTDIRPLSLRKKMDEQPSSRG
jgi:MbtH protein